MSRREQSRPPDTRRSKAVFNTSLSPPVKLDHSYQCTLLSDNQPFQSLPIVLHHSLRIAQYAYKQICANMCHRPGPPLTFSLVTYQRTTTTFPISLVLILFLPIFLHFHIDIAHLHQYPALYPEIPHFSIFRQSFLHTFNISTTVLDDIHPPRADTFAVSLVSISVLCW